MLKILRLILDENITTFSIDYDDNTIIYRTKTQIWDDISKYYRMVEWGDDFSINIDTFISRCKKYAYKNGYIVLSGYHQNNINTFQAKCFGWISETVDNKCNFNNITELAAVLNAINYIRDKHV